MPKPAVIFFDLDNTLLPRDEAFARWLEKEVEAQEYRDELSCLDDGGLGCRERFFARFEHITGRTINQEVFVTEMLQHIQPSPDLIHALEDLSENYKIGLISNGGSKSQRAKLRASGLDKVFAPERIWISAELGLEKPDPQIFLTACAALAVEPSDCVYVGDQDEIDGIGAIQAGLEYHKVWSL